MRRLKLILPFLGLSLLLTACWDIKSLQDVNYFTGIGIDYSDNTYKVYVQQLDFASVAKSEGGGKSDKPATVWIGSAEGKSISQAIVELYQTTQQTVFWGHLNAIVLSESTLKHGELLGVIDSLIRYPEIRYTPWVYGTKADISDLFTTKPFFNLSPINSILHSPETNYNQRPIIAPMRLSQFIREMREPGQTALLPSLNVSDKTWKRNEKPDPKLEIDGIFAIRNVGYTSWVNDKELLGIRWLVNKSQGSRITLNQGDQTIAELKLAKPKSKVRVDMVNGAPVFKVGIKVSAAIIELWEMRSEADLEQLAGQLIAEQVRTALRVGINKKVDLLNLEHDFYRKKYNDWNKLTSAGKSPLLPINLGEVKVSVKIVQSGMYKFKRKMTPY
ncbi:Ger(x)C family spore germination protein [Cohnella herbarum]|uniref:Ger(X)C family spore germination protein n=1 Tax=Cohnella herbarum TaxID=2728023 RepID=A0A7Z2VGE3_9BACL|nr:Ger(x)C family spore germination protein [Cohnella herbarum]QJD82599.1 Ger(x)C family spore germination protein [Cohnella herbarum]